eukprot:134875-Chlamydomonas_euryale.AAC.5
MCGCTLLHWACTTATSHAPACKVGCDASTLVDGMAVCGVACCQGASCSTYRPGADAQGALQQTGAFRSPLFLQAHQHL